MLRVVPSINSAIRTSMDSSQREVQDHQLLLDGYFQSHRIRNHSPKTIMKEKSFLCGWFESQGSPVRSLLTWEAMAAVEGRKRIKDYGATLIKIDLSTHTIRSYLNILSRYFSYVLEFPFILRSEGTVRIQSIYGSIIQPVSEFDMPHYVYEGERLGIPLDPERLYSFYSHVRKEYLAPAKGNCQAIRARNYTMIVLAGESGLRVDELLHLEISQDLFFDSKKIQTRFAKSTRGSGKRSRITLFTPLARDTVRLYLKEYRPLICNANASDYLFPAKSGGLLAYSGAHNGLNEILKNLNQTGFTVGAHMSWHWFRRIFATRFIERFPNQLPVLLQLLGHMSPNTVHRYIRHSEAWMDKQIQSVIEGVSP
ncbi:MAG: site-specific integrase [Bdellovibrionia bacterium]